VALGVGELNHDRLAQRLLDPAGGQTLLQRPHLRGALARISWGAHRFRAGLRPQGCEVEVRGSGETWNRCQHQRNHA
jgi:hypothetical protein